MSEGPPKKPQDPAESLETEQIDTQRVFDLVADAVDILKSYSLPGEANREIRALRTAFNNLDYLLARGQDPGPTYILYIRALDAVVSDEKLWGALEQQADIANAAMIRLRLKRCLTALEAIQIHQFPFTGSKQ